MNNQKEQVTKIDGLCKAGCIIAIICAVTIFLTTFIAGMFFLFASSIIINDIWVEQGGDVAIAIIRFWGIMMILESLLQILTIFLSANVLRGKAKSNVAAGVIALIFSGIIGGIFILVGKYAIVGSSSATSQANGENFEPVKDF